jgi:hypothetical protein
MKKLVLFFSLLTFVFSCSKYEDGPAISLRTKKHRLVNSWAVKQVLVNGNDSTTAFLTTFANFILRIDKPGSYQMKYSYNAAILTTEDGTWVFKNDKEYLVFDPSNFIDPYERKILRLKEKELWLYYLDNSVSPATTYELHLIPLF